MESFEIQHEFGKSYAVTVLNVNNQDEYQVAMITENNIEGLLPCRVIYEGNKRKISYEITNMISLNKEYENKYMNFEEMKVLFQDIINIYNRSCEFFLDDNNFLMNPDMIYRDLETDKILLAYLPGKKANTDSLYNGLADFLLKRTERQDDACVQGVYQFYRMSKSENFSLNTFMNILDKEYTIRKNTIITDSKNYEVEIDDKENSLPKDKEEKALYWIESGLSAGVFLICICIYFIIGKNWIYSSYLLILAGVSIVISIIFAMKHLLRHIFAKDEDIEMRECTVDEYWHESEETVVFNEETEIFKEETEIFSDEQRMDSVIKLEWKEHGIQKKYRVTSFPVVIGKLANEVDCKIDDSSVSRLHAKILKRSGDIYILDLNSTNGTSVDGERLALGEERIISTSSDILLGNVLVKVV